MPSSTGAASRSTCARLARRSGEGSSPCRRRRPSPGNRLPPRDRRSRRHHPMGTNRLPAGRGPRQPAERRIGPIPSRPPRRRRKPARGTTGVV